MFKRITILLIVTLLLGCQNDQSKNESKESQNRSGLKTTVEKTDTIKSTSIDISRKTHDPTIDSIPIDTNFTSEDFTNLFNEIKELGFIKFRDKGNAIYSEPKYEIIELLLQRYNQKLIIKKDSLSCLLLNRSRLYGLNEITDLLYTLKIIEEKEDTTFKELIISTSDFKNLSGSLRITIYGKVLSENFESTMFDRKNGNSKIPEGHHWFSGSDYDRNRFLIGQDTVFLIMNDDGFEMSSHIVTVWLKSDVKLKLISILDHYFVVGIGGIYIEEIITLTSTRKIIIGRESGADGDQMWGSLWLFVWDYPSSLRRIYEIDYDSENPLYLEKVDYSIAYDSMYLNVTKKHYNLKETDRDSEIIDSIINTEIISIDSIIDLDIYESIYE